MLWREVAGAFRQCEQLVGRRNVFFMVELSWIPAGPKAGVRFHDEDAEEAVMVKMPVKLSRSVGTICFAEVRVKVVWTGGDWRRLSGERWW